MRESMILGFQNFGRFVLFIGQIFKVFTKTFGSQIRPISKQIYFITLKATGTILVSGAFVGAILVLQFNDMLWKFQAQSLLPALNTSALLREIGPLLISFLLSGKIGAYTAAELGTMRVTDQIDAMDCLGVNSITYLVVPRFFGIMISGLLLLILGTVFGILESTFIAQFFLDLNWLQYLHTSLDYVNWETFLGSGFKAFSYCFIVASVCCYKGYTATGGARGVGRAVTQTAIFTNLSIVLANDFTSRCMEAFHALLVAFNTIDGRG